MATVFVVSDTHFGHEGTACMFKRRDGTPLRPFINAEEQDMVLMERWNKVVRPQDHVYHVGDVAMRKEFLFLLGKLNGHKRLVRGNHDIFPTKVYAQYFEEIYGVRVFEDMILSHVPLHPDSVKRFWTNVHGHLHAEEVMLGEVPDSRYLNVCVEHTDYTPISLEEVRMRIAKRKAVCG